VAKKNKLNHNVEIENSQRRLTVTLPPDYVSMLEKYAKESDLSYSWVIRKALGEFFERVNSPQNQLPL
jgi:predicted transcriptional regulator